MNNRIKWTERHFDFNFPVELYPEMIERLRGTPARLVDRISSLPADILTRRDGDRWSIQENAGHLLDLEPLVMRRLEEYIVHARELHAADMTNRKTYEANHNDVSVDSILNGFRSARMRLVEHLDGLAPEMFARVA